MRLTLEPPSPPQRTRNPSVDPPGAGPQPEVRISFAECTAPTLRMFYQVEPTKNKTKQNKYSGRAWGFSRLPET